MFGRGIGVDLYLLLGEETRLQLRVQHLRPEPHHQERERAGSMRFGPGMQLRVSERGLQVRFGGTGHVNTARTTARLACRDATLQSACRHQNRTSQRRFIAPVRCQDRASQRFCLVPALSAPHVPPSRSIELASLRCFSLSHFAERVLTPTARPVPHTTECVRRLIPCTRRPAGSASPCPVRPGIITEHSRRQHRTSHCECVVRRVCYRCDLLLQLVIGSHSLVVPHAWLVPHTTDHICRQRADVSSAIRCGSPGRKPVSSGFLTPRWSCGRGSAPPARVPPAAYALC